MRKSHLRMTWAQFSRLPILRRYIVFKKLKLQSTIRETVYIYIWIFLGKRHWIFLEPWWVQHCRAVQSGFNIR